MAHVTSEERTSSNPLYSVPILETNNWQEFKRRINEYLILAAYDDLLEEGDGAPTRRQIESDEAFSERCKVWSSRMKRACTAVKSRCGTNAHSMIEEETNLRKVMEKLDIGCRNQGTGSLIELLLEFWSLRLQDFSSVTEYSNRFRNLNKELKAISANAARTDLDMAIRYIHGLDASYDMFRANFYQNRTFVNDNNKGDAVAVVSFNALVNATLTEEKRIKQADDRSNVALVAAHSSSPATHSSSSAAPDSNHRLVKWCSRCDMPGHTRADCFIEHPEKAPKGWKPRGKRTHRQVKGRASEQSNKKAKKYSKEATEDNDSESEIMGVGLDAETLATLSSDEVRNGWLLDSGCSRHSTHKRGDFITYTRLESPKPIKGIGGVQVIPEGVGIARVGTKGRKLLLSDVYYVPSFGVNLISIGQLEEKKHTWGPGNNHGSGAGNGIWFTIKGHRFTSTKHKNVYLLDLATPRPTSSPSPSSIFGISDNSMVPQQALFALAAHSIAPELIIWHERMGHLGQGNLKALPEVATGVNLYRRHDQRETCKGCVKGTMRKKPHNKASKPGKYPMEFVVYDLGYCPVKGTKGEHYFGHIMCHYSKWGDVKAFKSKAEAFDYWMEFKARYQRPNQKIRRVRLDNGELKSKAFHADCATEGIVHEETVADNPEQNGASERHGQTIWRKVESILQTAGIPLHHWPEILATACYLANRSPHSALNGRTPYEVLNNCKPDLKHIRTIGSTAYNLVAGHKKKLADRVKEGKLVGYDGDSIYKILMPDGEIVRGSNVHIDERIPEGYKPRCKRKADSGESGDESDERNEQLESPSDVHHVAKKLKAMPQTKPAPPRYQSTVEDDFESDADIMFDPPPRPPPRSSSSSDSRTEYYEAGARTLLTHPHTPTPSEEPPSPAPSIETLGSVDELSLWAFVADQHAEVLEPKTYKQAKRGGQWSVWKLAAKEEYASLQENGTWTLVDRPKDHRVLQGKWVWKLKRGAQGQVIRHKARYVIRGDMQQEGIDFYETFASVVKPMSYKAIFAIAAAQDWEIEQMDIKTAFLYGDIDVPIYTEQPEGCNDGTGRVCRLNKALYGLKQAPRIWYKTLSSFLQTAGLKPLDADMSVFQGKGMIVAVYVDDILIAGPDKKCIDELKAALNTRFHMEDLGPCSYYLGMKITRDRLNRTLKLSQKGYIERFLKEFGMWECNTKHDTPMETSAKYMVPETEDIATPEQKKWYQSAVGSLMYAMLGTRPDIGYAVSVVSRFASNPNEYHVKAVKRIFRYLRGTIDLELTFSGDLTGLTGYTDADWAGCLDTRRSTNGYVFHIGSGSISWSAKRQMTVALSSCESEFMGQTQAIKEAIWLKNFLAQVHSEQYKTPVATIIFCDNQGAMALARNPQFHGRSKHMGIQLNWQREQVEKGEVDLRYTPSEQQIADGMTKALPKDRFLTFRSALGVI